MRSAGLAACFVVFITAAVPANGTDARGVAPLGVTAPVRITSGTGTAPRTYAPAAATQDPDDPLLLYAAGVDLRSRRCSFHRSADGGRTWTEGTSPSPVAYPLCSHVTAFMPMGALAVGSGKTIYYLHRGWSHQDEGPEPNGTLLLSQSNNGGDTWRTTVVRGTRGTRAPDNEIAYPTDVAVDATGTDDTVYVSWTTTYPSAVPTKPDQPTLSVSGDGGRTFSAPVTAAGSFFDDPTNLTGNIAEGLKKKEHFGGAHPYLAIDDRGGVAVSWVRRTANVGTVPEPRYLSRSTDRGQTFTVTELAPAGPLSNGGAVLAWTRSGTPAGTLHAVYEDKAPPLDGDRDVYYRQSIDSGQSWSEAMVLNDEDPAQLLSQLLPTIAAAPDGRVDVTWWDTRNARERYGTDVYYAYSHDAGQSWSKNIRLTPSFVSRRFGSWVENFGDTRQPPALASGTEMVAVVWDDTRNGTISSPVQDLYGVAVQFESLTSRRSSATTYAGAAAAGIFVGLIVVTTRRRARP